MSQKGGGFRSSGVREFRSSGVRFEGFDQAVATYFAERTYHSAPLTCAEANSPRSIWRMQTRIIPGTWATVSFGR